MFLRMLHLRAICFVTEGRILRIASRLCDHHLVLYCAPEPGARCHGAYHNHKGAVYLVYRH